MAQKDNTITFGNQTFTTTEIMNKVGCCRTTATKRMLNCHTKDELLSNTKTNYRKFIIEGHDIKVEDVMERVGCGKNTAYARLNSSKTLERLYRPLSKKCDLDSLPSITEEDKRVNKLLYGKW